MSHSHSQTQQEIIYILYDEYNCLTLSRKQCARELGVSTPTLDRWKTQAIPFGPQPIQNTDGNRTAVLYSISDIADFLSRKVIS